MTRYGRGDTTYQAMGGHEGIRDLVDTFYDTMEGNPEFRVIWSWHTEDRETMRDKLALFLTMWSGGPRDYIEKYGTINIPKAHTHLKVTETERNHWLKCMQSALNKKSYPESLNDYLMIQLAKPAESIRLACSNKS